MSRTMILLLLVASACLSSDATFDRSSPVVVHRAGPRDTAYAQGPLLLIGEEGIPEYEFFSVREVVPLTDGSILVANGGTRELRLYSPSGDLVISTGRRGEGPGEFAAMSMVQLFAGDTIVVDDPLLKRLTKFAPGLELVSTAGYADALNTLPRREAQVCEEPRIIGIDATGRVISWGWTCRPWQSEEGPSTISVPLVAVDLESGASSTLAVLDRVTIYYADGLAEGQFLSVPFTRANEATLSVEGILIAAGTDYVVERLSLDGHRELEIHDELSRRPVPDSVVQRYRDRYATQLGVPIGRVPPVPIPEAMPGFDRVVVDDGTIWASHFSIGQEERNYWSVYTRAGEAIGIAAFPAGFTVHAVAGGRAYGVMTNPLGVQRVAVFRSPFAQN